MTFYPCFNFIEWTYSLKAHLFIFYYLFYLSHFFKFLNDSFNHRGFDADCGFHCVLVSIYYELHTG